MKNLQHFVFWIGTILLFFPWQQSLRAQTTCNSPVALTIGANDNVCNSVSFVGGSIDLDNIPVAVNGATCGVGADHAARWYQFTGNGNTIRVKIFGQNQDSRILVFENQACSGTMTALTCGGLFPDDDLPHVVDVNTVNGATYLVAVFRGSGSATMTGSVCAYTTNGDPFYPQCDGAGKPLGAAGNPVPVTVSTEATCSSTSVDITATGVNSGITPRGNCTPAVNSHNDWWGRFVGTGATLRVYTYSSNQNDMTVTVYEGGCAQPHPAMLECKNSGSTAIPTVLDIPTVNGEVYLVRVQRPGSNTQPTGKLCVFPSPGVPYTQLCDAQLTHPTGAIGNPVSVTVSTEPTCGANSASFNTTGMPNSGVTPLECSVSSQNDWWATFTGTGATLRVYTYDETHDDVTVTVYEGPCAANLTSVDCIRDGSSIVPSVVDIPTVNGLTYYVRIQRATSNTAVSGKLCVFPSPGTPYVYICDETPNGKPVGLLANPANLTVGTEADCNANAQTISIGADDAWASGVTPTGCGGTQQREYWSKFTATSTKTAIYLHGVNSKSTGFVVYTADCGTTMTMLDCAGLTINADEDWTSYRALTTTIGETYYIRTYRSGSNTFGSGKICVWDIPARPADYAICPNNGSFESGNTSNWECRRGFYNFAFNFPTVSCMNPSGDDVPLYARTGQAIAAGDRHVIMTDEYGRDVFTNHKLPVLAPGGSNYSFRLGNPQYGCGDGTSPCPSQAESMRHEFLVTAGNAGFSYMYAAVLCNPGHAVNQQPRFEVFLSLADGTPIDCGYKLIISGQAGNNFVAGYQDGAENWQYTDWTEVNVDLSGFVGAVVRIEFRVSGCYIPSGGTSCVSGISTMCDGGVEYECACGESPPHASCVTTGNTCTDATYSYGTHSGYAYIDAHCIPVEPGPCSGVALPVELVDFSARPQGQEVALRWVTASELNNDYFVVERTLDGVSFERVAKVKGAGNSNSVLSYKATDHSPYKGTSFYRLKQVDYDGKSVTSSLVSINFEATEPTLAIYPNPSAEGESINMDIRGVFGKGDATVIISDFTGKVVFSKMIPWSASGFMNHTLEFQEKLSAGVYIVNVVIDNTRLMEKLLIR